MNIQELLDYRTNCFYCSSVLEIFPSINFGIGKFSITDNWLRAESRFIQMDIHVLTGEVQYPEGQETTVDQVLKNKSLKLTLSCLNCPHEDRLYEFGGWITRDVTTVIVSDMYELLMDDNYILRQNLGDKTAGTLKWTNKTPFKLPYLDTKNKNITPDYMKNKLKTYLVFS